MSGAATGNRGNVETTLQDSQVELVLGLAQVFEPITLQRPMALFPTSLGLQPGAAGIPSDEFLAALLLGRPTFLAAVRGLFGSDFKNFQNYARQRVKTTADVRDRLLSAVGGDAVLLETLARVLRHDPKVGDLSRLVRAAEGVVQRFMLTILSGSLRCPQCRHELISRPMRWWSEQPCVLGASERRFVDRILRGVMATVVFPHLFSSWAVKQKALDQLAALCRQEAHPFRQWLSEVGAAYRAKDLTALAARAGLEAHWAPESLQRMSRGEMLTAEMIEKLTARLAIRKAELRALGMRARALAFVVDFLLAADMGAQSLNRETAQAIVGARLQRLVEDLRLNALARHWETARAGEGPASVVTTVRPGSQNAKVQS